MIKVLELFSGYGGASFGLKKAGIKHKVIGYSDILKSANYIFALNHGHDIPAFGDITKINIDNLEDFDLLTGGFPCTDVSIAGLRDLSRGHTVLFNEIIRIAEKKKPKYMLLENVEGICTATYYGMPYIRHVLNELIRIGYTVRYQLMKSKDYGTPQNRPRVWFACFRNKDEAEKFIFPQKETLKLCIKDLLEKEVDKKYFLTKEHIKKFREHAKKQKEKRNTFANVEQDINSFSQTLCSSSNHYFKINKRRQSLSSEFINSCNENHNITNVWRRLTPRECFRLMGFFNDEINFGNVSDSKLYFMAGNGWDINVASKILSQMIIGNKSNQKSLVEFK